MFYLLDQPTEKEFQSLASRYEDMDPSSVKATVTLLKIGSDLLTAFEGMLQKYGVSQARFLVLLVMNRQPDSKTNPSILAEKIGVKRATMTGLIAGLEKDGLIERSAHPDDRRKQDLLLTDRGKRLLKDILPDYWYRIKKLMQNLSTSEEAELIVLLNSVASGISSLTNDE